MALQCDISAFRILKFVWFPRETGGILKNSCLKGSESIFFSPTLFERTIDSDPFNTNSLPGGHSKWVPPDPIPNSEVKLLSADGSTRSPRARVGHCQALISKTPMGNYRGFFSLDHTIRPISIVRRFKRVFRINITDCEKCRGPVKILSCIVDPVVIEKILRHLRTREGEPGIPYTWLTPSRAQPAQPVPSDSILSAMTMCPGGVRVRAVAGNSGNSRSLNEEIVTIARHNLRTTPDFSDSDNRWVNWTSRNILYSLSVERSCNMRTPRS